MKNKLEKVATLLNELSCAVMEIAAEQEMATAEEADPKEKKAAAEAAAPKTESTPPKEEEAKGPTLEEVRTVLAEISRAGKTAEMKELLRKFDATKLSDVCPEDYPALLRAAQEVSNA